MKYWCSFHDFPALPVNMTYPALILASSSPYRAELLDRLKLEYTAISPDIDESQHEQESPRDYVQRLSQEKAAEVAKTHAKAMIIGSDQCAVHDGEILTKPGSIENAEAQLTRFSGSAVQFLTGLCLLDAANNKLQLDVVTFNVHFRTLTNTEIKRYIELEMPLDCAGSFKSEGLGVTLFERLQGDDPTALVGLPLIRLCSFLRAAGIELPPTS